MTTYPHPTYPDLSLTQCSYCGWEGETRLTEIMGGPDECPNCGEKLVKRKEGEDG